MAYTPQQRKEHIRELQRMLYAISFYDEEIPRVVPDGIYGRETAMAVRAFQQKNNLRPTGETNRATWDAIVQVYLENIARQARIIDAYPQGVKHITAGDEGFVVYIIQAMLNLLTETFDNFGAVPLTGRYDKETIQAVKDFQRRSGQNQTGHTDPATWNLLVATTQHTS